MRKGHHLQRNSNNHHPENSPQSHLGDHHKEEEVHVVQRPADVVKNGLKTEAAGGLLHETGTGTCFHETEDRHTEAHTEQENHMTIRPHETGIVDECLNHHHETEDRHDKTDN